MISDVYFPRINGVSTSIETNRHQLQSQGHRVTLVVPDYGQRNDGDLDIIRIPSRYLVADPEDRMMKWGALQRIARKINPHHIDLVHIQTPFIAHYAGLKLAKRLGVPTIETYHTFFEEYLYHYIPWLPKALLRLTARSFTRHQCNTVDTVIVPSTPIADALSQYGVKTRIEIIPTGIELGHFSGGNGDSFRHLHGIPRHRPTLVHVGRLAFEKNLNFLIEVTAHIKKQIPDILLIIAGEGPAGRHLPAYARQLGLEYNIHFVGYLSREKALLDCYMAGDVFVFSSQTETQGLVLIEAMALGVPVVSTAILGTKDVLREGCGALIAQEDVAHFSSRVIEVLENQALRIDLSKKARLYAKGWSADVLCQRLINLYDELLTGMPKTGLHTSNLD